jgi:hypothetical protein
VWNIGSILQGLASSILSRLIAAVSGLGNAFHDVDRSSNGVPVKRGYATGRISHLDYDKFPGIAGQWKAFENLTCDTGKPGLFGAVRPIDTFSHVIANLRSAPEAAARMSYILHRLCLGRIDMRNLLSLPLVTLGKGLELTRNGFVGHGFGGAEQGLRCFQISFASP